MSSYDVADLLDKNLIASKDSVSRTLPRTEAPIFREYKKGEIIGKPYSFVERGGGVWLQFNRSDGKSHYFDLKQKAIDKNELSLQGVKTLEEKKKEQEEKEKEANKDWFDRLQPLILGVVALICVFFIAKEVIAKKML